MISFKKYKIQRYDGRKKKEKKKNGDNYLVESFVAF